MIAPEHHGDIKANENVRVVRGPGYVAIPAIAQWRNSEMTLFSAIPALPVANIDEAVAFYGDRLGFAARHREADFAIVCRDEVEIHLWLANDEPGSGAEPELAGSASCRIRVSGLGALYEEYRGQGVIHPNGELRAQWLGGRDFTALDQDHNAIAFFEPTAP